MNVRLLSFNAPFVFRNGFIVAREGCKMAAAKRRKLDETTEAVEGKEREEVNRRARSELHTMTISLTYYDCSTS